MLMVLAVKSFKRFSFCLSLFKQYAEMKKGELEEKNFSSRNFSFIVIHKNTEILYFYPLNNNE